MFLHAALFLLRKRNFSPFSGLHFSETHPLTPEITDNLPKRYRLLSKVVVVFTPCGERQLGKLSRPESRS